MLVPLGEPDQRVELLPGVALADPAPEADRAFPVAAPFAVLAEIEEAAVAVPPREPGGEGALQQRDRRFRLAAAEEVVSGAVQVGGIVARPAVGHEFHRPQRKRRQGADVVAVVGEHRFHGRMRTVPQVVEEHLRNPVAGDVVVALDAEQLAFEDAEPGVFVARPEEPPRRVEEVEVAQPRQRVPEAVQREAGFEQRQIEAGSVVGDEVAPVPPRGPRAPPAWRPRGRGPAAAVA